MCALLGTLRRITGKSLSCSRITSCRLSLLALSEITTSLGLAARAPLAIAERKACLYPTLVTRAQRYDGSPTTAARELSVGAGAISLKTITKSC